MWATAQQLEGDTEFGTFTAWTTKHGAMHPVLILPLDDIEGLTEQCAKAAFEVGFGSGEIWEDAPPMMRIAATIEAEAVLKAAGFPVPNRKTGKALGAKGGKS